MYDYLRESLSYFGLFRKMLQVRKKYKPVRVSYGDNKEQYFLYYEPEKITSDKIIVWVHGGGWNAGNPKFFDYVGQCICEQGYRFVSLGYRLSPKYKYPCQIKDVCNAYNLSISFMKKRVIDGEKEVKVDSTFNSDDVSADELKAEGFTVNGLRASKTTVCKTRKYIFKQLPQTVEDFEGFSLDTEFGPVAATICAFAAADIDHYNMQNIDSCPTCAILDRLNGKCFFNNFDKQHLASSLFNNLRAEGAKNCFFAGAATENGYTPDLPLSFELYVGPYEIPAKVNPATGINRPATLMVLLL